jgi:proline dehydrogenase
MGLLNLVNKGIVSVVPHLPDSFVHKVASRYIARETIDEVIEKAEQFKQKGVFSTINLLGEHVQNQGEANVEANEYRKLIQEVIEHKLSSHNYISLKLSQLGLTSKGKYYHTCKSLMREIISVADDKDIAARIDMEDSNYTDNTLKMWKELHQDFSNLGFVVQARLERSLSDVKALAHLKPNVRVCKGIYPETEQAYVKPYQINANFIRLADFLMQYGCYTAVATHDQIIINAIKENHFPQDRFEFQMLYGVDNQQLIELTKEGYRARVYLPYGNW